LIVDRRKQSGKDGKIEPEVKVNKNIPNFGGFDFLQPPASNLLF
jgi:hypothetical protein